MKKVVFLLMALLSASVSADSFIGLYNISTNTISNTAGVHDNSNLAMSFGQSTDGALGVGYEAFFTSAGLGASVGLFANAKGHKFSVGVIAVPDKASRISKVGFPVAGSSDLGEGLFVGYSVNISGNKFFSLKYIRYDVGHTFISSKQTGVGMNNSPIITTKTGTGEAEREQLWVGITFNI